MVADVIMPKLGGGQNRQIGSGSCQDTTGILCLQVGMKASVNWSYLPPYRGEACASTGNRCRSTRKVI